MKHIVLVLVSLMLSACAVGPLVSHETARSVGKGNKEFEGGYGTPGFVFKINVGITDDLDIGFQMESLSLGLRLKYAILNQQSHGFSLGVAAGTGASVGGKHYYGDLQTSYLAGRWEPYSSVRIVHVTTDPVEFKDKDTGTVDFTVDRMNYDYGQFFLGTRFWFDKKWSLSVEASDLFAVSRGVHFGEGVLVSGALACRF